MGVQVNAGKGPVSPETEVEGEKVMVAPVERYKLPKGKTKKDIIDEFHRLYYMVAFEEGLGWMQTQWLGIPMGKMPNDLNNLTTLLFKVKPRLVIETGTDLGGSALYMATFMDLYGIGRVVTVDIKPYDRAYPGHHRITYMGGHSSTDKAVVKELAALVEFHGGPVMVILDSDHSKQHVLAELDALAGFVTPGSYLIVEDTNVNREVLHEHGPGPADALDEWLPDHPEWQVDTRMSTIHLFSMHTWLRRLRG